MKKSYIILACLLAAVTTGLYAQQLPNSNFEDWSAPQFDGVDQPKSWNFSNVTQFSYKFNFAHKEAGHNGGYCAMCQDQEIGAAGITEVSPGYLSLGTPWVYIKDLFSVNQATAGDKGGMSFKYRPDTMQVWIKRTGSNYAKEDFHLLFYSWKGTAKGTKYQGKNESCTTVDGTYEDEESDVRQALDANRCGTDQKATQVAEGWWRERKEYGSWTCINVPIFYFNDEVPDKCNVIFSASNYPNFRANSGLFAGNSLYVDDIKLIYSSKIHTLYIDDKEWKGFDPDSEEEQTYSLGEKATTLPKIEAFRGAGSLTNTKGTTVTFPGRKLSGSEITITNGVIDGAPTTIVVKAEDGSSTHTYKIKFVRAASTNANLAGVKINGENLAGFKSTTTTYNVELPFGTTAAPVVEPILAEDAQTFTCSQASTVNGKATITVIAADKKTTKTYTLNFSVAELKDNTLQNILVNGEGVIGFVPTQTIYKVSLPLDVIDMPTVEAVSAYPKGAQTIVYTAPDKIDGGTYQISVSTKGNPTPKVYKLNFKKEASAYSRLKDLRMELNGVNYINNFDPDNLTYYVNLPLGTTSVPKITWEKGDRFQSDPEIQDGGLDGTTRVIVTAASGAQTIYKIVIATEKSSISYLKNIFIDGVALTGFSSTTLKYTHNLEVGTTKIPTVTVTQGDEYQTVTITYGGLNEVTRVTVVAGDGSTTIYQITFAVKKSTNSKLADIKVGGVSIPNFNPETLEYYYTLAKGDAVPEVTAVKAEAAQTVNERKVTSAPGDYKLTVVAESGAKQTYIIHFVLNLSHNANLDNITIDGTPFVGFNSEKENYEITLDPGVSIVPEVGFIKGDNGQKVIVSENNNTYTLQVTAEDGYTSRTYTVKFILQISENMKLAGLKLVFGQDTIPFPNFNPDEQNYTYTLGGAGMPTLVPVKADNGQQVAIAAPVGTGKATIVVTAETGAQMFYWVAFVKPEADAVLLDAIYAGGSLVSGWNPAQSDYKVIYPDTVLDVKCDKRGDQKVTQLESTQVDENNQEYHLTTLYVYSGGESKTYTVKQFKNPSKNALLDEILLDGEPIASPFAPTVLNYNRKLTSDTEPVITFKKKEKEQTVVFGQLREHAYQIVVLSAEGKDTTVYTINFEPRDLYTDTKLEEVRLDGTVITFDDNNEYNAGVIPEGSKLKTITYTKAKGQTVLISDVEAYKQQIVVVAENGNSETYTINYIKGGADYTNLKGILLDGDPMKGFDATKRTFEVMLKARTAQVPAITPLSDAVGQIYNISYGRVNARTTLEVIAKDGVTKDNYYIDFKVEPLTNCQLDSLWLDINGKDTVLMTDPTVLEYTYTLEDITAIPTVMYTKADEEQTIEYTRGRGGETWIKVTAQNGDNRTYHVRFVKQMPTKENVLKSLKINGVEVALKDNIVVQLAYGETNFVITPEKNFESQAILVNNGGVALPSQIIVMANNPDVPDKVYTITPSMPEFDNAGKLQTLTFKNNEVPNFKPNVYNYVVNVTEKPAAADFKGITFDGTEVTTNKIDQEKKQIVLEVSGGEKYYISWFYQNDGKYEKNGQYYDYLDFSQDWVATTKANMLRTRIYYDWYVRTEEGTTGQYSRGYKPYGWTVPADKTAGYEWFLDNILSISVDLFWISGKEVLKTGQNGALLSTMRGASTNGSVPGMMTLGGTMAVSPASEGNTTSSITYSAGNLITLRNTPDSLAMWYTPMSCSNITSWSYKMYMSVNNAAPSVVASFTGNFNDLAKKRYAKAAISNTTSSDNRKFGITINSAHTEQANELGNQMSANTIYSSDVQIEDVHFVYNSDLTKLTIDGENVDVTGKDIIYDIADSEYAKYPNVKVTGRVHDQEQLFTWQPEVLEGNKMVRKAVIRNFGEDHSYTDYNLAIRRPACESNELTALKWDGVDIWTGAAAITVTRSNPYENFPDIEIERASVHQKVSVTRNGDVFSITVIPELGDTAVYTVTLIDPSSNDATLAVLIDKDENPTTPVFDKNVYNYTIKNLEKPLSYNEPSWFKTITQIHTLDSAKLLVTAEDKTTKATYTFHLATKSTSGLLGTLFFDGKTEPVKAGRNVKENGLPEVATFTRQSPTDSVSQTIAQDSLEWRVFNHAGVQTTYTYVSTANKDDDARLKSVLVNGENYQDFDADTNEPTIIPTDSMVNLEFIARNLEQTISISLQSANAHAALRKSTQSTTAMSQGFIFNVKVIAADGSSFKDYTFRLEAPKSSDATLKAIIIGNDTIKDVNRKNIYTLPIASGPKKKLPLMPDIKYIPTDPHANVEVEPAGLNQTNYIRVTPADGSPEVQYELVVEAAKSTYAQLDNIMIGGTPIADFQPDRYFYSVQVEDGEHTVLTSSPDYYQTVDTIRQGNKLIFNVLAEDGQHSERYLVELYQISKSNNATLSNILVDGKTIEEYDPSQKFDPNDIKYDLEIESTTKIIPDVRGIMAVEGQQVTLEKSGYQVKLHVTAPDNIKKKTYTVNFNKGMDDDVTLKTILLDGDTLNNFTPEQHIYQLALPVGQDKLPTIYAQRSKSVQKMPVIDVNGLRADITVTAEDGSTGTYTIMWTRTYSMADSLIAIYADNQLIKDFKPRNFYYALTLPVEAAGFPELTWEEATEFQQVRLDTLHLDSLSMMCQIEVIADTMSPTKLKNVYTITYERELWAVDTIQMIYVDNKPLEGFSASKYDYSVILPAGTTQLPLISYDTNDKFKQTITLNEAVDSIATKSLNKKIELTVTAENGKTHRTYTIHFPVELSSEASLNLIQYGGQLVAGFDAERTEYKIELPIGTTDIPVITVGKKEEAQKVDIYIKDWNVTIDVVAEDGIATKTYTIEFALAKSQVATLSDLLCIYADRTDTIAVIEDVFEYNVVLPVGDIVLPKVDVVKMDSLQAVEVLPTQQAADGSFLTTVIVTAPDEETQLEYTVIFTFGRSTNADLAMIYLDGEELAGFHTDSLEYHIEFPSGTSKDQYYTVKRVTYKVADKLATDTIWRDENYTIFIDVTAQDGTHNTYSITQSTALADNNWLKDIWLDSVPYRDFDPEQYFYTYYIKEGASAPSIQAFAEDSLAEVSIKVGQVGDTTLIMCTAENGDVRIYRILFTFTTINDSDTPTSNDVLVKRLFGGTQILVATIRANVAFALYDRNGHLVEYFSQLPVCDPNDAIMDVNANGQEVLNDVVDTNSGVVMTLAPNTIYFYAFYEFEKRRITSGKLVIVNGQGQIQ